MLFSQSALTSQLCLHFLQELKQHTLGNKDHSRKLFWAALAAVTNALDVWGTVSPLVVSRSKALVGSMDEAVFLSAIWLPHIQLWVIIKGVASLTQC